MIIDHNNWYQHFFDGLALDLWTRVATPDYAKREIGFIKELISFPENACILDMPCGQGWHSLLLAEEGYQVTGVDLSPEYISNLEKNARERNLPVKSLQLNMLDFTTSEPYDVVLCLGNSFSYFNAGNMQRLTSVMGKALRPGGKLVINTGSLAECILPHRQWPSWMQLGDMLFLMAHEYDCMLGALKTDMQFIVGGKTEQKTAYHFAYTLAEINRFLKDTGIEIQAVYSDFDKNSFKAGDHQAYIVAEKK
jgi:SAM-dependent methyltransferase